MRVVLASGNRSKLVELRRILEGLDVELVPMLEFDLEGAEETGDTFEENALIKARAVAAATGLPALADDSGLEVDALGGAPGVHSARYAGIETDDIANNRKLREELAAIPEQERTARFVCVAALVTPDGREWTERGTMEGRIVDEPRGEGGFGYDPLFVSEGETRTNAELSPEEKDARSHRGEAFRAIRDDVARLAGEGS
ncbi:MAG: RdgB/HAM1 family non-canonical purine NTP pyrophosphatase [Nitriliruptorales bacterium]|nr:RdgB/HAM1 family non-canonical purine NTP pyrophosphatase [Nitriliruptorales bacterium]